MKSAFLTAALVVALGCARSASPPPATTAAAPAPKRELQPIALSKELAPRETTESATTELEAIPAVVTPQGGVGITGPARSYGEQLDPSGWSGRTPPPAAIGGGPSSDENPYEDESK